MKINIITLFPETLSPFLNSSILKRARQKGKVQFELINLRDYGIGKHQTVDDRPYGGGAGMVLRADTLAKALKSILTKLRTKNYKLRTILMSASGKPYNQAKARQLTKLDHLIIICGHYEGTDQRFIENYVDEEISIGDYILTGGEIPALVLVDSITRLIPGVLKKLEAIKEESFSIFHHLSSPFQLLEYPQYTKPENFEKKKVPKVLLSGNHQKIREWRKQASLLKTKAQRPDLLKLIQKD